MITENGIPLADNQIFWKIANSGHRNAEVDNMGRVHSPGLWALHLENGTCLPEYNVIKNIIFDPATTTLSIVPVYPNIYGYQPWDTNGNGTVDSYDANGNPNAQRDWNYPHWDSDLHDSAMQFHYNNLKITKPNDQVLTAIVWQNSYRAREYNQYSNPEYAAYATVPEIFIAISPSHGYTWHSPIKINNVETDGFAGNRPMWVYPAHQILGYDYLGGKLGLMYYHDNSWGAYSISPGAHTTNDGGIVKFTEIEFTLPPQIDWTGISGYITNASTGDPVPYASINVSGYQISSEMNGRYSINVSPGTYSITVTKIGFF